MAIEQEIAAWAAGRPSWQQSVLLRLAKGQSFGAVEIRSLASDLAAGKTLTTKPLQASDVPGAAPAGDTIRLHSLRDLANVNALAETQELTFSSKGLTVVYGDNASGKSGYARVIKSVVRARHQEPVHTNVFASSPPASQKAEVVFDCSGDTRVCPWPDGVSDELRAIAYYDEACGDAYIGGESDLTYRPSALTLFDGLIGVCDAVRDVLDEDLRKNQASRGHLPSVPQGSNAAKFLAGLTGRTTTAQVDAMCVVPSDSEGELARLIQEEARLRATDPSQEQARLRDLASRVEAISAHVKVMDEALSDTEVNSMTAARDKAAALRAAATVASSEEFENEPLPGVGSATWRALWEAARRFSETEAYHDHVFPVTGEGAHCVLCQQALSAEGSTRLEKFDMFLRATTAKQAIEAEQALERMTQALQKLEPTPPDMAAHLLELRSTHVALTQPVAEWLESARTRQEAVLSSLAGELAAVIPGVKSSPATQLDAVATDLRLKAGTIDATQFQADLSGVVASRSDLEGRLALGKSRDDLTAEMVRLAERAKLESAKRQTDTTGITRKTSELAETHVTALVRDRFTRESVQLRLERIELKKTGGQKGKLRHRPSLLGARDPKPIDEVLSEGEQTALGLAGFFTEAYFDESKSALVLDDPVTSLDHRRRSSVATRLAQLSADRQVVIFTHDVSFVGDLRRAANEEQVTFTERGVERRGDKVPGVCLDHHPWKAKDVGARFQELEQTLARIKRERSNWVQEEYEEECAAWAGKLSETWERLINLEIVHAVVDHGTSEVRPKMFKLFARITDQDDREFQQSYGRCSAWARRHDKSPSTNYVPPEPDELEQELASVRTWYERVRRYKN